jgi:hypothetical protein
MGYGARCIFLEIFIQSFIFRKSKQNKYIKKFRTDQSHMLRLSAQGAQHNRPILSVYVFIWPGPEKGPTQILWRVAFRWRSIDGEGERSSGAARQLEATRWRFHRRGGRGRAGVGRRAGTTLHIGWNRRQSAGRISFSHTGPFASFPFARAAPPPPSPPAGRPSSPSRQVRRPAISFLPSPPSPFA